MDHASDFKQALPMPRDLARPRPIKDLRDIDEALARDPPPRPQPFAATLGSPVSIRLDDLERTIADPEHGVAVGVTDLKYHQAISVAAGIIAKLKTASASGAAMEPHELAAAMNAWGLEKRAIPTQE